MESSTLKPNTVAYLQITSEQAGQRIDNFLHTHLKGVPKTHLYRILRTGEVRVNKSRIKPTYRLQNGDVIRLPPLHFQPTSTQSPAVTQQQQLAQAILYEDNRLIVINKPAGMAVHGGSGIYAGVIEALRALYPQLSYLELVHRLDRDTSGCLMIAKKSSMLRRLHDLLRNGEIDKQYLALVQGHWNPNLTQVELPLRKNILSSGERIVRVQVGGKHSVSQFQIERHLTTTTLLRIKPLTGRTHQIRVHTAQVGHPIAGDNKYGDDTFNQKMRQLKLNRLFLHAEKLSLTLPELNFQLAVVAPLPPRLTQVLHHLDTVHVNTV
jgi:23S rRNA pseudouridine955/2504/2580 synthase